jgi:ribokinase
VKICNFGSLNIDHVYAVDNFVQPGETISSSLYRRFAGGKGCNQSIALAHAGACVYHAGKVGKDGVWLRDLLAGNGVDTSFVEVVEESTGHAVIQVNRDGENSIILHGGANRAVSTSDADRILGHFSPGDYLLVQNETSAVGAVIACASRRGLITVLNPAPMDSAVADYPLELVDYFILNKIEGKMMTGEQEPDSIMRSMLERYPGAATLLTLGKDGVIYGDSKTTEYVAAERVVPVDTTGAGDTFVGYFLASLMSGAEVRRALQIACRASAICVTRPGAAESIPKRHEVEAEENICSSSAGKLH